MTKTTKLLKKIVVEGEIELLTGMAIGGSSSEMNIGGIDKSIIRHPITKKPYIPGSSLKGKMRSLIELRDGTIGSKAQKEGATNDPEARAAKLFGYIGNEEKKDYEKQQPSRLIVRDGNLIDGSVDADKTDLPYTEIKTENSVDRITSAAHPRTFERVPAGAKFSLNLVLNIFEHDKSEEMLSKLVFEALEMVQDDYLGGSGSRGYGQVKFLIISVFEKTNAYYMMDARETENLVSAYREKGYIPKTIAISEKNEPHA
ncbi:MAG: type III-A CRISPR-associated RAMP protein Csm3 [Bernardetiaceae bacterium]